MKHRLKPGENGGQSVDDGSSPGKRRWWLNAGGLKRVDQWPPSSAPLFRAQGLPRFVLRGRHMAKEKAEEPWEQEEDRTGR